MQFEQQKSKQKTYKFDQIIISSQFESGNTEKVLKKDNFQYQLWIGSDPKSTYRSWFYFTIQGVNCGNTITFTIMNLNNQMKLFKEGHLPVWKSQKLNKWDRISIPVPINSIIKCQDGYQLTFKHFFMDNSKHHFAFSFPWTNKDQDDLITNLMDKYTQNNIFWENGCLGQSKQERSIKILTLTKIKKNDAISTIPILNNGYQAFTFKHKKGIFVSARVHPGQVASSYILNGLLKLLISGKQDGQNLLQNFVFYIIPIINPDGVFMGNFRNDSEGQNLNRHYLNPTIQKQPQIYQIKQFLTKMIKNKYIQFCLDLHAHVNKQGAFIYGNSISDLKKQLDVCLFAKILSYNSQFFDYQSCNFSQKNMNSKDKNDQLSKQGASRVAIYKQTGLPNCWTLQCNYHSTKILSTLPKATHQDFSKNVSDAILKQLINPQIKQINHILTIQNMQQIGKSIGQSILDYYHLRKIARIYNTKLKNYQNFKINLAINILRMIPFKFDNQCRKILSNLNNGINNKQTIEKLLFLINNYQQKSIKLMSNQNVDIVNMRKIQSTRSTNRQKQQNKISFSKKKQSIKKYQQENKRKKIISVAKMVPLPKKNIGNF